MTGVRPRLDVGTTRTRPAGSRGAWPDLPESLALTVYRIVQEALSNVVRHALGAPTTVEVVADGAELRIRVVNEMAPRSAPRVEHDNSGQGLVGMRERVAVAGGRLTVGPGSGGFVVEAVLPLGGQEGEST